MNLNCVNYISKRRAPTMKTPMQPIKIILLLETSASIKPSYTLIGLDDGYHTRHGERISRRLSSFISHITNNDPLNTLPVKTCE